MGRKPSEPTPPPQVKPAAVGPLTKEVSSTIFKNITQKSKAVKGPENAQVTIVEYSDFQCPFCARAYHTMETEVLKEYGSRVRFVSKTFPLPFHPWAEAGAVAVKCVLQQSPDAYWRLYDYYFENQKDLSPSNLKDRSLEVLRPTGIDAQKFGECFDNKATLDLVKADIEEGTSAGVKGTPAFLVNGHLISGAQPFSNFKTVIDGELSRGG